MEKENIGFLFKGKLRDCQTSSIDIALKYLNTYEKTAEGIRKKPSKACLLSLPTGAGKSGVITVVTHRAKQKRILVLCHRSAVRNQLFNDINGGFYEKIGMGKDPRLTNKKAYKNIANIKRDGVFVTTFQTVQRLNEEQLKELQSNIDLVIVDEGHSEPSLVWRELVRGISAHRIVVTATPYRNDLFQFDIDEKYSYIYTFGQATRNGVISCPEFKTENKDQLKNIINGFLKKHPDTVCIVKCKYQSDVNYYYDFLKNDFETLALHDGFKKSTEDNKKEFVPTDIKSSKYKVIIHQRKIDEGVDIPQAKLLILTYEVSSGRELVQTVGRVVRIFNNVDPIVYELNTSSNSRLWNNYLHFDSTLQDRNGQERFLGSLNTSLLIERYLSEFPDASYYGNRFIRKFNLTDFDPSKSLVIPSASVCFYKTHEDFSLSDLADNIYWSLHHDGELVKEAYQYNDSLYVICSVAFNRSRFLVDEFFFEPTLEVVVIKKLNGKLVAIFDSRNKKYQKNNNTKLERPIRLEDLLKVSSGAIKTIPREVSSRSITTAKRRPEAILLKGRNLDELSNTQANSSYALSTLRLDNYDVNDNKVGSYYLGMGNGRISDQLRSDFTLESFDEWLSEIDGVIAGNKSNIKGVISSFAMPIQEIPDENISSIVFDFSDLEADEKVLIDGKDFFIEKTFIYFKYDDGFLFDPLSEKIKIEKRNDNPFYNFICDFDIEVLKGDTKVDVNDFLYEHTYKVLYSDGKSFSDGEFYSFRLPSDDGFTLEDANLNKVIISIPELLKEGMTEKGEEKFQGFDGKSFSKDSIFYLIDKLKGYADPSLPYIEYGPFREYTNNIDLMICTDMGTEPADFIISSPSKLIFVHVKCGNSAKRPESSAGAIAEVGGQAIKNIEMMISTNADLLPGNVTELQKEWPSKGKATVNDRIRVYESKIFDSNGDAAVRESTLARLWDVVSERRKSPLVDKEIWMVIGNAFCKEHFEKEMAKGNNAADESLQAYQLLQSYVSIAYSNDVDIKVFVSKGKDQ
ncbi:TPA: DEAD/DEAH box helicase family protein [Serratia marcescens]|nr:DEAD/DEAH box helicase family protein [Serratia marcescens]